MPATDLDLVLRIFERIEVKFIVDRRVAWNVNVVKPGESRCWFKFLWFYKLQLDTEPSKPTTRSFTAASSTPFAC